MPGDHRPGAAVLLEAPHRTQPRLQSAVICFETVVAIPVGAMPSPWQQLFQRGRVHRREVGDDLHRHRLRLTDRPLEEPTSGRCIPPWGTNTSMTWPNWVDCSVHIPPSPSDLHIGLVHEPAISYSVSAGAGGLGQQRREPLEPPLHADMVDVYARSASSSSTSRQDRPKRRYQRTATTMTSGRKRKPAKAERGGIDRWSGKRFS